MKKILLGLLFSLTFTQTTHAHPLDISISIFNINSETENINISTYLHPFEVGYLLDNHKIKIKNLSDAYQYKDFIFEYILYNIDIKNNGEVCEFVSANLPPKDEFELIGEGLEVQYEIKCKEKLGIIEYKNSLFSDDFELQTNKNIWQKDNEYKNIIHEKILTSKITDDSFDYTNPEKNLHTDQDTDQDGLTDHEENLYFTNINKADTDFDGYDDKVEIDNGWDARNPVASMGQDQIINPDIAKKAQTDSMMEEVEIRQGLPQPKIQEEENQKKITSKKPEEKRKITVTTINTKNKNNPNGNFFGTSYLTDFLKKIQSLLENNNTSSKIIVLLMAFLLGALHSLEPGHGKSILTSYLIDQKKDKKDALRFASFMTITHLLDVIILGIIFKIFSMNSNAFDLIFSVQKWGAYLLILISLLLIARVIFDFKTPKFIQNGKALGIASGLAPCTIGWALMIAMLSIGQINWLFPVIICFGLGIFSSLMTMSFIILKTKSKIIKNSNKLAKISSIGSALLLFIFAIGML